MKKNWIEFKAYFNYLYQLEAEKKVHFIEKKTIPIIFLFFEVLPKKGFRSWNLNDSSKNGRGELHLLDNSPLTDSSNKTPRSPLSTLLADL